MARITGRDQILGLGVSGTVAGVTLPAGGAAYEAVRIGLPADAAMVTAINAVGERLDRPLLAGRYVGRDPGRVNPTVDVAAVLTDDVSGALAAAVRPTDENFSLFYTIGAGEPDGGGYGYAQGGIITARPVANTPEGDVSTDFQLRGGVFGGWGRTVKPGTAWTRTGTATLESFVYFVERLKAPTAVRSITSTLHAEITIAASLATSVIIVVPATVVAAPSSILVATTLQAAEAAVRCIVIGSAGL